MRRILSIVVTTVLTCAAASAEETASNPPSATSSPGFDLSLFEETGETRLCVLKDKIAGIAVPANGVMFFFVGEDYYLNRTLNECRARRGPTVYTLRADGPQLCRNHNVYPGKKVSSLAAKKCVLGEFRRVRYVGPRGQVE